MFFSSKIANTLSIIRVGYIAKHRFVKMPVCKYTINILNKLQEVGYIETFYLQVDGVKQSAVVTLSYTAGRPTYANERLLSKASRRVYVSLRGMRQLIGVGCVVILTTSRGILTAQEAMRLRVGGEALILLE